MRRSTIGIAGLLMLSPLFAGCDGAAPDRDAGDAAAASSAVAPPRPSSPPAAAADGWIGRWVGVEGLVLTIARGDRPATYRLHIVLMDGEEDHVGIARGDTIRFEREGAPQTIRRVTGAETGLKWLAEKRECLVIRQGEGFCRDRASPGA